MGDRGDHVLEIIFVVIRHLGQKAIFFVFRLHVELVRDNRRNGVGEEVVVQCRDLGGVDSIVFVDAVAIRPGHGVFVFNVFRGRLRL